MSGKVELMPGNVLLFTKDSTMGVYTQLKKWIATLFEDNFPARVVSEILLDWASKQLNHRYIHAEIYIGSGYTAGAWFNGIAVYRMPLRILSIADVYRPKVQFSAKQIADAVYLAKGRKYDFPSLLLNGVIKVLGLGDPEREKALAKEFAQYYANPDHYICSEFIAKVYEHLGYQINEKGAEYTTPDDIANSKLFYWEA